MDIVSLYLQLLENPRAKNVYIEFQKYYLSNNMKHEASAFVNLLENKFAKNDNNTTDNTQ